MSLLNDMGIGEAQGFDAAFIPCRLSQQHQESDHVVSQTVQLDGIRVLLVEDEPLIALDCETMLRRLGVGQVLCATNVPDADAAIARGNFDVAILDVAVGDSNSLQLCQRLKARSIPVGIMSGYSSDDLPQELRSMPFVSKPFSATQLGELLHTLLKPAGEIPAP